MKIIVIYKTKYGSTRTYAEWIADALNCDLRDAKHISLSELDGYDTIIYGGGLYGETINGVHFITRNFDKLKTKNIVVYTTGITPLDCREYYDKMVADKNFKPEMAEKIKMYNYLGKMLTRELSFVHRTALKSLKALMQSKENPSEMEKLLINLCDVDADLTEKNAICELVEYVKGLEE